MLRRARYSLPALFLAACSGGATHPDPEPAHGYDFAAVDAAMSRTVSDLSLSGATLILMHGDTVIYQRSIGGIGPQTVIPIASASKWVSGTVIMSLVADGTLSLDQTVGRWIPDAPADKRSITLRQLFSHTSGIPGGDGVLDESCISDRSTTLDACARELLDVPMEAAPGAVFDYGGHSMQVAGRIAEIASGRAWNQLFALRVAGPVGMSSTSFGVGQNPRIAGGVVSTAEDYARMLRMLAANGDIDGRRVLPAAAVQEMERDQTGGATIVYSPYIQYGAGDVRYGVGLWRDRVSPSGQLLQVSSGGAFGFMPWIDRERGIVGVFAVVDEMSHVYDHVSEIQALVRTAVDQAR